MKRCHLKYLAILLLFSFACGVLSACTVNQQPQNTRLVQANVDETTAQPPPQNPTATADIEPSGDIQFAIDHLWADGSGNENGYYRVISTEGGAYVIYYVDYATQVETVLCSRLECTHSDETCTAWFPYGSGILPLAGIQPDKVYLVHLGGTNDADFLGSSALARVEVINANGSGRKTLYTFEAAEMIDTAIAYDNGHIYFVKDSYKNMEATNGLPTRQLCVFNFADSTVRVLQDIALTEDLIGAYGSKLVLSNAVNSLNVMESAENMRYSIQTYDVEKNLKEQVLEHDFLTMGQVYQNKYYMVNPAGDVAVCDLDTHANDVLYENLLSSCWDQDDIFIPFVIFDDQWAITVEYVNMEEIAQGILPTGDIEVAQFVVNLATGEVHEQTMHFETLRIIYTPILAYAGDYYLVMAEAGQSYNVTVPAQNNSTLTLAQRKNKLALILKEDYWNDNPNFKMIEEI